MQRTGALALFVVFIGCSDPESPGGSAGGDGGQAGGGAGGRGGSSAGAGIGGSSGIGAGGSAGSSTGGKGGSGGSSAGAGNAGTGGSSARAGSANAGAGGTSSGCECPATAPQAGEVCPEDCSDPVCAYEDCNGEGFIQAGCGGEWLVIEQECGDKPCGDDGTTMCAPGSVCIQIVGGAISGYSCVPHECGTGAITCDCVESCPGECTRTGGTTFTCNTCPSGLCP